jgi:hypothetical protein
MGGYLDSRSLRNFGMTSIGIGAALLAIPPIRDVIGHRIHLPPASDKLWEYIAWVGIAMVALGVLGWLTSGLFALGSSLRTAVERITVSRTGRPFRFAFARMADLPGLREFYQSYFRGDTPTLPLMEAWVGKCESAFVLEYDVSDATRPKLVGSFKLLPLNTKGVRDLEMGAVTGSTFTADHICSSPSRAAAFYVGDLCAEGLSARAVIVKQLEDMCEQLIGRGRPIYARPFTAHGRQVMVNNRFSHVSDGNANLKLRQLCRLDPRDQGLKAALSVRQAGKRRRKSLPKAQV